MPAKLQGFRQKLARSDALLHYSVLGVAAGVLAGLIMLVFRFAIEWPLSLFLPDGGSENFESLSSSWHFFLPLAGGLFIGLIRAIAGPEGGKVGVAHVIDCENNHHGHLPLKNAVVQFFAGALSIISGHSAGREGPGIHLGAALNSVVGRALKLPNNSLHIMVGCGTAAAIGAAFNTPLAGVIFAMEVIMMEYTIASFTPIVLAAAAGTVVSRIAYGPEPAFSVPVVTMHSLWEIPYIILLGAIAGVCAALFIAIQKQCLDRFSSTHYWLKVSIASLLTGCVAVLVPEIMGTGYDTLDKALLGEIGFMLLLVIVATKLVVTSVCSGLGIPFGIIGPSMVIGGCLGGAMGMLGLHTMPDLSSSASFYVLLGMGAVMGAVLNAPLAALTALMELTYSPTILMPAMLAIVTANLVNTQLFRQRSFYDAVLHHQGILVTNNPLKQALKRVGVASVVNPKTHETGPLIGQEELNEIRKSDIDWLIVNHDAQSTLLDWQKVQDHLDEEPQKSEKEIHLLELPVTQRKLVPLHAHATLHEAWNELHNRKANALYVSGFVGTSPVSGIITERDIETYFRETKLD
jgi:CIC family chloride channel protein